MRFVAGKNPDKLNAGNANGIPRIGPSTEVCTFSGGQFPLRTIWNVSYFHG